MKITIQSEPFGITKAPKLTKKLFNYIYAKWYIFRKIIGDDIYNELMIETINIRINQALEWTDLHVYVSINEDTEIHMSIPLHEIDKTYIDMLKYQKILESNTYGNRKYHFNKFVLPQYD